MGSQPFGLIAVLLFGIAITHRAFQQVSTTGSVEPVLVAVLCIYYLSVGLIIGLSMPTGSKPFIESISGERDQDV